MFKVLIAEDELLVRLGIKASINWEKFDMTVIADAGNGQEAWDIYERLEPDLILTDIKMPVMDGITLIEKIREKDVKTKIIILTCLEEFELARKAVSLGVSDYILKLTMSQAELEAVLKKAQNELLENHTSNVVIDKEKTNFEVAKENILRDYIFYGIYSESRFAELISGSKLRLSPENLVLCIMEIDQYEILQEKLQDEQGNLIRFSLLNVMNEILDEYKKGSILHEKDERYIMVFSFPEAHDEAEVRKAVAEILEHIRRALKTYFDTSVTFAVSSIRNGYDALKSMYHECVDLLEYKYFMGKGKTINSWKFDAEVIKRDLRNKFHQLTDNLNLLNDEYKSKLNLEFDAFIDAVSSSRGDMQKQFLKLGHLSLLLFNLNKEEISDPVLNYTQQIGACETLEESFQSYTRFLKEILNMKMKKKSYRKEVITAIKYIRENYNKEISLHQIADFVELSPNYLCSLFKKELDVGLIEYLTQYRIEKAKELFLNTNLKSYEIAERVGFTDESYFSRTFKRIVGVRPNQFKRQAL